LEDGDGEEKYGKMLWERRKEVFVGFGWNEMRLK
jgi:hypothetical protein